LACLLCQRAFKSRDVLEKHCQKSDLHKKNVTDKKAEMGAAATSAQATTAMTFDGSSSSSAMSSSQYRDRAKERRQKHGLDPGLRDTFPSGAKDETELKDEAEQKQRVPLDESNVGNRLLKSMGWSEGRGLGRNEQGIVNPIAADQRVQGVGLGATGSRTGISMRERVQQTTIARFNNIRD